MVTTQRKRLTSGNLHFPVDGKPEDKAGEGTTLKNHPAAMALVIGLAVSGGSSVWNDLLTALSDFRKSLAK